MLKLISTLALLLNSNPTWASNRACEEFTSEACSIRGDQNGRLKDITGHTTGARDRPNHFSISENYQAKYQSTAASLAAQTLKSQSKEDQALVALLTKQLQDEEQCTTNCSEKVAIRLERMMLGYTFIPKGVRDHDSYYSVRPTYEIFSNRRFVEMAESLRTRAVETATLLHKPDVERVFNETLLRAKAFIESRVENPEQRRIILAKLDQVELGEFGCNVADDGNPDSTESTIDTFLLHPAFLYENKVYMCAGYLDLNTSDYARSFMIAHELAHLFDPCRTIEDPELKKTIKTNDISKEAMDRQLPFGGAVACLSSSDALENTWGHGLESTFAGAYSNWNEDNLINRYCKGTQIGEAFPDWFATEMVSEHIATSTKDKPPASVANAALNSIRHLCGPERPFFGNPLEPHSKSPWWENRMDHIFATHPMIRSQLGCRPEQKAKSPYCAPPPATQVRSRSQEGVK
jgi:hypothetical protein